MSKLLINIVLLFSNLLIAQNYIPLVQENRYWDISYAEMAYICPGYNDLTPPQRFFFQGDTIINNLSYKKVFYYNSTSIYVHPNCAPFIYDTISHEYGRYFREDTVSQQVFMYNASSMFPHEFLLYDFSLNKGDTMQNPYLQEDFIIDTVYFITTSDGLTRKVLANNSQGSVSTFPNHDTAFLVEGLGTQFGIFDFPTPIFFEQGNGLMCFKDSTFTDIVGNACFSFANSTIKKSNLEIKIYPNPNSGIFNIDSYERGTIEILNVLGDKIHEDQIKIGDNEMNLSSKPKGLYLLKIKNDKNVIVLNYKLTLN